MDAAGRPKKKRSELELLLIAVEGPGPRSTVVNPIAVSSPTFQQSSVLVTPASGDVPCGNDEELARRLHQELNGGRPARRGAKTDVPAQRPAGQPRHAGAPSTTLPSAGAGTGLQPAASGRPSQQMQRPSIHDHDGTGKRRGGGLARELQMLLLNSTASAPVVSPKGASEQHEPRATALSPRPSLRQQRLANREVHGDDAEHGRPQRAAPSAAVALQSQGHAHGPASGGSYPVTVLPAVAARRQKPQPAPSVTISTASGNFPPGASTALSGGPADGACAAAHTTARCAPQMHPTHAEGGGSTPTCVLDRQSHMATSSSGSEDGEFHGPNAAHHTTHTSALMAYCEEPAEQRQQSDQCVAGGAAETAPGACGEEDADAGAAAATDPDEAVRSHIRIPKLPMVLHSRMWYRARLLEERGGRCLLELPGFGHTSPPFWLPRDSERIWRGSYKGKDWKYLGNGAWDPKPCAFKRGKLGSTKNGLPLPPRNGMPAQSLPSSDAAPVTSSGGTAVEPTCGGAHTTVGSSFGRPPGAGCFIDTSSEPEGWEGEGEGEGPLAAQHLHPTGSRRRLRPQLPLAAPRTSSAGAREDEAPATLTTAPRSSRSRLSPKPQVQTQDQDQQPQPGGALTHSIKPEFGGLASTGPRSSMVGQLNGGKRPLPRSEGAAEGITTAGPVPVQEQHRPLGPDGPAVPAVLLARPAKRRALAAPAAGPMHAASGELPAPCILPSLASVRRSVAPQEAAQAQARDGGAASAGHARQGRSRRKGMPVRSRLEGEPAVTCSGGRRRLSVDHIPEILRAQYEQCCEPLVSPFAASGEPAHADADALMELRSSEDGSLQQHMAKPWWAMQKEQASGACDCGVDEEAAAAAFVMQALSVHAPRKRRHTGDVLPLPGTQSEQRQAGCSAAGPCLPHAQSAPTCVPVQSAAHIMPSSSSGCSSLEGGAGGVGTAAVLPKPQQGTPRARRTGRPSAPLGEVKLPALSQSASLQLQMARAAVAAPSSPGAAAAAPASAAWPSAARPSAVTPVRAASGVCSHQPLMCALGGLSKETSPCMQQLAWRAHMEVEQLVGMALPHTSNAPPAHHQPRGAEALLLECRRLTSMGSEAGDLPMPVQLEGVLAALPSPRAVMAMRQASSQWPGHGTAAVAVPRDLPLFV